MGHNGDVNEAGVGDNSVQNTLKDSERDEVSIVSISRSICFTLFYFLERIS